MSLTKRRLLHELCGDDTLEPRRSKRRKSEDALALETVVFSPRRREQSTSPPWSVRSEDRRAILAYEDCGSGVPFERRREIWRAWCGAEMTPSYERGADAKVDAQIDKDVRRTLRGADISQDLTLFLGAAAADFGYVQGMNYVAAFVILVAGTDDAAFGILRYVLGLFKGYYEPGFPHLVRDTQVLTSLLPCDVRDCLDASGASPMTFAPRFFVPLGMNTFPGCVNVRLWDVFLADGQPEQASAVMIWALLGLLVLALPDLRKSRTNFVHCQDAILAAARNLESFDRLRRAAPLDLHAVTAKVLSASSTHCSPRQQVAAVKHTTAAFPEEQPTLPPATPPREEQPRPFGGTLELVHSSKR